MELPGAVWRRGWEDIVNVKWCGVVWCGFERIAREENEEEEEEEEGMVVVQVGRY